MGVRLEPVGPLPAGTYWRRRAVVLGAVLVLLLLLMRACGGGDDEPTSEGLAPGTPTGSPSTSATTRPPATGRPSAAATTRPPTTAPAAPVTACTTRGGLRVVATTDARRYPVGSTARFTLTVTNTGSAPCRIGLGQGSLELRVASGDDRIWSSDDCAPGGAAGVETLAAGARRETTLSWSLTRSAPGCDGDRPAVRPGTYVLGARAGELFSALQPFQVVPAG